MIIKNEIVSRKKFLTHLDGEHFFYLTLFIISRNSENLLTLTENKNRRNKDKKFTAEELKQIEIAIKKLDAELKQKELFTTNSNVKQFSNNITELSAYGTDLTKLAKNGLFEPCIGRDKEISELMEILVRRQKNNPVLIGEAGVGKTAIVELFATKLAANDVPFLLTNRKIFSLDLSQLIGGATFRGEFEERLQEIINDVLNNPNIIVFIDEIHRIVGLGNSEGSMDAANLLKPILSRSGFQCIGATTIKEYEIIEKDPALNRRFQAIKVNEPSILDTIEILYGLRSNLELFHNVEILPGALKMSAELTARYIPDRFLPDKAIDLVDRAAARVALKLTDKNYTSIVDALVNKILRNIAKLRNEAFRKGDIATEFIFQEIENAYRNFLLMWINDYSQIPEKKSDLKDQFSAHRATCSPLSSRLFEDLHTIILTYVDKLLFGLLDYNKNFEKKISYTNLSVLKNAQILKSFLIEKVYNITKSNNSLYRCSLILFTEWLNTNFSPYSKKNKNNNKNYDNIIISFFSLGSTNFIYFLREFNLKNKLKKTITYKYKEDSELIKNSSKELAELDKRRILILEKCLKKLKPLISKGLIEANTLSGDFEIEDKDINSIYQLLGYFSMYKKKNFQSDFINIESTSESKKKYLLSTLKTRIGSEDIQKLLAEVTGIPLESLNDKDLNKLLNLEKTLHERVIGQEDAISAVSKAVRRSRMGVQNPNKPIASFLFCGPTGVGKTEVTKALTATLFGSDKEMIRFDMSEFMEKFALTRLIGSPPGYIGYEDGGELTNAVRRKPYAVILFDELEKAHPEIMNILLQILEDGRLTDSQKRIVGFENTIIIMTSNAAATEIQNIFANFKYSSIINNDQITNKNEIKVNQTENIVDEYSGMIKFIKSPLNENYLSDIHKQLNKQFKHSLTKKKTLKVFKNLKKNNELYKIEKDKNSALMKEQVMDALSQIFLPEFINRIDDIIVFQPLTFNELHKICDILIDNIWNRIKKKGLHLIVEDSVKIKLAKDGYNIQYGARPLRRLVTKYIEDTITESLIKNPNTDVSSNLKIFLNEENSISYKRI